MALSDYLKVVVDNVSDFNKTINSLTKKDIYVGVPDTTAGRKDDAPVTNAVIGYTMEYGNEKLRIPARPHLIPGVNAVNAQTVAGLERAAKFVLNGDGEAAIKQFNAIGTRAVSSVKRVIRAKIPPPLAAVTVKGRLMRTQAGRKRLAKMTAAGVDIQAWAAANLTPLIDTADYINSITYVIRDRK